METYLYRERNDTMREIPHSRPQVPLVNQPPAQPPTHLSALLDIVFKYLLGSRESTPLLTEFINAVEKDSGFPEIEEVTIENPFNEKTYPCDKLSIIDVRARDKEGKWYNIEVQLQSQKNFPERSLYYWAETYAQQLEENNQYNRLNSVVSINLLNFICFPQTADWHNCFLLKEQDNSDLILTLDEVLHFIEIKKVEDRIDTELARWVYLLTHLGREEEQTMKVLFDKNKTFRDVKKRYDEFTADEHARAAALARKMFLLDQNTREYDAREEGKEEGKEEGLAEGETIGESKGRKKNALETAAKLKTRGMSIDEICEITSLAKEEIEKL